MWQWNLDFARKYKLMFDSIRVNTRFMPMSTMPTRTKLPVSRPTTFSSILAPNRTINCHHVENGFYLSKRTALRLLLSLMTMSWSCDSMDRSHLLAKSSVLHNNPMLVYLALRVTRLSFSSVSRCYNFGCWRICSFQWLLLGLAW